ncbi:MAG: DUF6754 domain-containing protein [Candidatus Xenobia bacterium]
MRMWSVRGLYCLALLLLLAGAASAQSASPSPAASSSASPAASASPEASPEPKSGFKTEKLNNLLGVLLVGGSIAFFLFAARKGRHTFIRRIAGLQAVEEAVGRATEMGKPILYLTGLLDVDDPATLAALSILGHVAKKSAEYETPLMVPCCRSVVMSTAQEVVKEAYLSSGRAEAYNKDNIRYLSDDQFGFVAGVDGIMMRDKPAANFFMGYFYAESLVLAETGHSTGAIQIAGTNATAQLPFFVAACDYTLMGEELFAASAYLSRDPQQVGSLKGQDFAKVIIMICIVICAILYSLEVHLSIGHHLMEIRDLFKT